MRFLITPDQREFFHKHHFIEFEGLLSKETAEKLCKEASLYKSGYDLWRHSSLIKSATQKLSITQIASEMFQTRPLRIAFDQLFTPAMPFYQSSFSLTDISSIKPLAGGIFFLLEDFDGAVEGFPLPSTAGNALFLSASFPIPWPLFSSLPKLKLLLVAFAPEKSFYRPETRDTHSPLFKKMGYVYNDLLKEPLHPIVFGKK